jgi:hypothetical protein
MTGKPARLGHNMPAVTREQRTQAWNYIISALLEQADQGPIPSALQKDTCNSLPRILGLTNDDIDDDASTTTITPLMKGEKGIIRALKSCVLHQSGMGISLKETDWMHVKKEHVDEYHVGPSYIDLQNNATTATHAPMNHMRDPITDFKKGIKTDHLQFPNLKDDKQWDLWDQDVKAQVRCHQGVGNVCDGYYTPRTSTDVALFDEKQKFLCAVFLKTVLTDQGGKALVRQCESSYDAQKVCSSLVMHASKSSTKAAMDSTDRLLSYITSVRLGNGAWKGTTHAFISRWENQLCKHEQLNPPTDQENTIGRIAELRAVKA